MTEEQKVKLKFWIILISTALCVGGIVYAVYKAKAMVNRLSALCSSDQNLNSKLFIKDSHDGLLDGYSKEDLRELAKDIEANKIETLQVKYNSFRLII